MAANRTSHVPSSDRPRNDCRVVIVRATRKLLPRLSAPAASDEDVSTTMLGDWYATFLNWRPSQVALFVSETTLLPVLFPLAPASSALERFPSHLAQVLRAHGVEESVIALECSDSTECRLAGTSSRSVVGSMNEFGFLADAHRAQHAELDLLEVSMKLSTVPCGPLYKRYVSPDRELHALVNSYTGHP